MPRRRWTALMLGVIALAVLAMLLVRPAQRLQERLRVLELRTEALEVTAERERQLASLRWLPDANVEFRVPSRARRDALTDAYRKAYLELSYALYTGNERGLSSYFREAALVDALQAASVRRERFETWNHRLDLYFFAPKGDVAAFRDTYCYRQWVGETTTVLDGWRALDVVMRVADDGVWRVHQWRVLRDEPISRAPTPEPGGDARCR